MQEPTLKHVAILAGVAPVTVSRVINGSENVAAATRQKILAIIQTLDYTPNIYAANLRRRKPADETAREFEIRPGWGNKPVRARRNTPGNPVRPAERTSLSNPGERQEFAQQMLRLRRDLDRLRKHTERIKTCVDTIQEAYSRQLLSRVAD